MTQYRFDARNAEDYDYVTQRIAAALARIRENGEEPATKAGLAHLAGVHRNTLYKRALSAAVDANVNQAWPFSELTAIREQRRNSARARPALPPVEAIEAQLEEIRMRLEKSRYVAGSWFHRCLQLKQERDEALRQVECLVEQADLQRREIEVLRTKVKSRIGVAK